MFKCQRKPLISLSAYINKFYSNGAVQIAPTYRSQDVERNKYKHWEDNNFFQPEDYRNSKRFSLILPPPNITGTLHLGHALTVSIEDAIVRWHRMNNHSTVWVPGLDHAGIATQVIVEKQLWAQNQVTRHGIGREEFVKRVWHWKEENENIIVDQLRQLGASLDWTRTNFTLDPLQSKAVNIAFITLFNRNLIYRSKSLVNWSCSLQSAISDIEVDLMEVDKSTNLSVPGYEHPVEFGVLYNFAYELNDSHEKVIITTTRPETILGDVAIIVHPDDPRYTHLHGKQVRHPFSHQLLPILIDEFVDRDFGTGAVKITPAHDKNDFEIAEKLNLPKVEILDENGVLKNAGNFNGLKRFDARNVILNSLNEMGLYMGKIDHKMNIPLCSRSKDIIEYILKPQWFVNCKQMAIKAINAVESGHIKIEPEKFNRNWNDWLTGIRDWNISRQLWWGHRIPAYECLSDNQHFWIAAESEESARKIAAKKLSTNNFQIKQDDDVLDTWFSSSLLPFTNFGWPNRTKEFNKYYPLDVLETGHDILFFWVARMVMLGIELTDVVPFKKILLHGIICDMEGRKMSKSLGNVVSPNDVIHGISLAKLCHQLEDNYKNGVLSYSELIRASEGQKRMFPNGVPACGTDALRFTLCSHDIKSHFISFDLAECNTNRLFCNKIWQLMRFSKQAMERKAFQKSIDSSKFSLIDKWIMSRLSFLIRTVNSAMDSVDLHLATKALRNFFYAEMCDVYVECIKPNLKDIENKSFEGHCITLYTCLDMGLRCLAPFMPFITEELYVHLIPGLSIHKTQFPTNIDDFSNRQLEDEVEELMQAVVVLRRIRDESGERKPLVYLETNYPLYSKFKFEVETLGRVECRIVEKYSRTNNNRKLLTETVGSNCTVYLELINNDKLKNRNMDKKELKLFKQLEKLKQETAKAGYKEKASEKVKHLHKQRMDELSIELQKIQSLKQI